MGYIGITCAYIDNQFKLNEAILAIKYMPYSHTSEAIAEEIMSILNEWKLTDKVFTITTDNGNNMVKSAQLISGLIRIPCTAHTLQLVIGKGLLPAEDIINIMITALCIDSDKQAKKDGKWLKDINLTEDEWNAISELVPILEPFANATELLGGSQYATVSFMYPAINVITRGVKPSNSNINEVEAVDFTKPSIAFDDDIEYKDSEDRILLIINQNNKIKSALYESIIRYWNIPKDYGLIATLLDPRCKSLFFISPELHNDIHLKLRSVYNKMKLEYSEQEKKYHKEYPINSLLASMFSRKYERGDEFTKYLRVWISFSECPFNWWSKNENRFPLLSKMVRKYLAIPATSTPSEKLFSNAGNLMTVQRTSLSPSIFEHLLFLK
ncbi:zinc finger BED domain-containing protein 1-like [Rhizophagus clarus]|uniref:Zinc finger BED domain-containing protein 1-like n=1 Tax=Rhizophagus clarus TaxID=94130 RepID=A0A8H3KYW9_9GLOM|nr:zinc finger BED domain-containing protein 1-like [Rhizophagus clarus]